MIVSLVALLLASTPASQPTFGIVCKTAGELGPDNQLKQFAKSRAIGVFVGKLAGEKLQIGKTLDPTQLLVADFSSIQSTADGKGFFAATSNGSQKSEAIFAPGESGRWNDWRVSIKRPEFEKTKLVVVGTCMLMDGATLADFDQISSSLGNSK